MTPDPGDAMHAPRRLRWLSFSGLLVTLTSSMLHAQDRAAVEITVRAADDARPLPGADVRVAGLTVGGTTDERGHLRLRGVPVGDWVIEIRLIGYTPFDQPVGVNLNVTTTLEVELAAEPIELAPVDAASASDLGRRGFYERKRGGNGTLLDRAGIERIRPRYMSDLLRRVGGIHIGSDSQGAPPARMRGQQTIVGPCPIQYFIDGVLTSGYNIEDMRPEDVEGIEIYRGAASIPAHFNRGTAMCGAILIWTRVR